MDEPVELVGHTSEVTILATGPLDDRTVLGAGAADGSVRLWNLATAEPATLLGGHTGSVGALAFGQSAEGRTLVATAGGADGSIQLWDAATGDALNVLPGPRGRVTALSFGLLRDGRTLLASASTGAAGHEWTEDGSTRPHNPCAIDLWNPTSGDHTRSITCPARSVGALILGSSYDGRDQLAATCDDGAVRLWDPDAGTALDVVPSRSARLRAATFGRRPSNGTIDQVAIGTNGLLYSWWLGDYPAVDSYHGPIPGARALALSDRVDLIATARDDGTVLVQDFWVVTHTRTLVTGSVSALCFGSLPDRDTVLATGHREGAIRVWDCLPLQRRTPTRHHL